MGFFVGLFIGIVATFACSTVFALLLLGAYSRSLRKRGTTFASVEAWEAEQAKERVLAAVALHARGIHAYVPKLHRWLHAESRN